MPAKISAFSIGAKAVCAMLGWVIGSLTLVDTMAQQVSARARAWAGFSGRLFAFVPRP